jgi:hypothetical protein
MSTKSRGTFEELFERAMAQADAYDRKSEYADLWIANRQRSFDEAKTGKKMGRITITEGRYRSPMTMGAPEHGYHVRGRTWDGNKIAIFTKTLAGAEKIKKAYKDAKTPNQIMATVDAVLGSGG